MFLDIFLCFKIPVVAVHARQDDMAGTDKNEYGIRVAPKQYFVNAMNYLRNILKSPVFVVGTNDYEWTQSAIGNYSDTFILRGTCIYSLLLLDGGLTSL